MATSRHWRAVTVACAAVLVAAGLVTIAPNAPTADATSGSDFSPGKIITDQNLHASNSMNASQIQSFLESKESGCRSGYTCLKDYRSDTASRGADTGCAAIDGQSSELASSIIWRVAVTCGINPQVLLVLLEKEQGLVSSTSPSSAKYNAATGYNCPDSTGCSSDPKYGGLGNQLYWAAWQFGYYEAHTGTFSRYAPGKVDSILYSPNTTCGTAHVYVETQATADLYYYTPYTPNQAALDNLYGTGDGCSAYGNRNFWRIYSDWFGSPSGPPSLFGSVDGVYPVVGGIQVSGWSYNPYGDGSSSYIWINVDGSGGPVFANLPLDWIDTQYPGAGPNHGFDTVVEAAPGAHQICVYNTVLLGCQTVTVSSNPNAAGAIETATSAIGKVTVTGWSLDKRTWASSYVWVNVDGSGGPAIANAPDAAAAAAFPQLGGTHGFSYTTRASTGSHLICVYGVDSVALGCKRVSVPTGGRGSFDTATAVSNGISISGWSLDLANPATSTYLWVNVDGSGGPVAANGPLNWIDGYFPGAGVGANHGFSATIATSIGTHQVCVYGTDSISLGCKTVTVQPTARGSFDTATATTNGISVSGWSLDLATPSASTWVWFNVDGAGGPVLANSALSWIDTYFSGAGVGPNHGFSATIPASVGTHQVCAFGSNSIPLGCKTVTVQATSRGSFDTATPVSGGVAITGWSLDLATPSTPTYIWVNVDGAGGPAIANAPLDWIDGYFSGAGVGPNHGFGLTVPASVGTHQVCVFGSGSVPLGCKSVTVR